ncbi:hypothetical protein DICSQDRAFT_162711 [Dichomitus squalens LYAD-421 SS1]|uniref:TEA domain-containing protein n=2 Tax=Dichomitus squalens TaxID=114155 RepID=A0A4Q9MBN5_9APHY|nr:uncharacterized protein DICSQDRAFT_162711 [Dichomitus squalens LYAD-421 SS1]EJF58914.1 hypothetical protein DICSQDRAFT_162711 [Dichomitus squalens LYAD-421 SS1]TBU24569.1 hypothetical protein BD311DRAFT_741723 [Dichomitus squalens]
MSFETAPANPTKNFQTILAGRKCYRLEKYTPAESKSPRGLTRFPNRNKFIAEYILKKTGEIRTAKQVGSRIQQLRDTSAGKTIMKAISDRHYEMMHPTRPSEPPQDMGMADVYFNGNGGMLPPMNQVIHVYISVPTPSAAWTETYGQTSRQTEVNILSSSAYSWGEPRPLRAIDPTVTFTSPAPMTLWSSFTVYCGSTVMHIDQPKAMKMRMTDGFGTSSYLHCATLAPGYWDTLCTCADLSPYIIVQEITKQPANPTQKPIPVMMIHYHFNTTSAPPLSPFALADDDLEVDYESDEMLPPATAHALSTSSDSPYPSDRDSSPSYSIPGFCSQPLSPVEWTSATQPAWAYTHGQGQHHSQQLPLPLPHPTVSAGSSSSQASASQLAPSGYASAGGAYGMPPVAPQHQSRGYHSAF